MDKWHKQQLALAKKIALNMELPQKHCGDILDRMPCVQCKATSIRDCPLSREQVRPTVDLINRTAYLGDVLRREAEERRKAKP
ncbi:hypothetical protein K7W03_18860 [Sphingobium sp. PNB]|uniref:hypothetical protein n=1 Tax=Sphingobium sp. PNB TaxID=863934 RepID=UPI001CA42FAE|nr:hypothetical protein [Sphingobium sp. PNB]MCB4861654.1 hypothetical protein [Sphingobium sp. PNB]